LLVIPKIPGALFSIDEAQNRRNTSNAVPQSEAGTLIKLDPGYLQVIEGFAAISSIAQAWDFVVPPRRWCSLSRSA